MTRFLLLAVLAAGCGKGKTDGPEAKGSAASDAKCVSLPFADSSPVPEASGAGWMTIDGKLALVVISDSGNDGAYAIVDPDTGETREQGKLPLGDAGEDLEGIAVRGDKAYVINSAGWMRVYARTAGGFELVEQPYPIGEVTLSNHGGVGDTAPRGTGMVCGAKSTNCGRNYEGLCLGDPAHVKGPCVGFVASKADGHVYCLEEKDGKLLGIYEKRIRITKPGAIGDCAFSDDGSLYVGSNLFDMSMVYRVDGWADPATARVERIGPLGVGFPETIAARGDVIYRMSDTGGAPSLMSKFRCTR